MPNPLICPDCGEQVIEVANTPVVTAYECENPQCTFYTVDNKGVEN